MFVGVSLQWEKEKCLETSVQDMMSFMLWSAFKFDFTSDPHPL